jgi:hypothetical protein
MICSFKYSYTGSMDNCSASSLKQQSAGRHVAPFIQIILLPSQPIFALAP